MPQNASAAPSRDERVRLIEEARSLIKPGTPEFDNLPEEDKRDLYAIAELAYEAGTTQRPDIGQPQSISSPSFADKAKMAAYTALREGPEAAGATAGGLLGPRIGMPAPAGAAFGGMLGRGVQQAGSYVAPSIFGPPTPGLEGATKLTEAAALNAVAELGAQALPYVTSALTKPLDRWRSLDPRTQARVLSWEREDIPYSAGDVRPGGGMQQFENLLKGTFLGGTPVSQHQIERIEKFGQWWLRVKDRIGPLVEKEEFGRMMKGSIAGRDQELYGKNGLFDTAYKRFDNIYKTPVDSEFVRKQAQTLYNEIEAKTKWIPSATSPENPSRFLAVVKDLTDFGRVRPETAADLYSYIKKTVPNVDPNILRPFEEIITGYDEILRRANIEIPETLKRTIVKVKPGAKAIVAPETSLATFQPKEASVTYNDAWNAKQMIDAMLRSAAPDDPMRTQSKAILEKLHWILDTAMEKSITDPKAKTQIRDLNNYYREMKDLLQVRSIVKDMDVVPAEDVVSKYFGKGTIKEAQDVILAMPPSSRDRLMPYVRRQMVENLIGPAVREVEGNPTLSGKVLQRIFRENKEVLGKFLTNEQMNGIKEFIMSSETSELINPASGRQMLAASQAATIGRMIGGPVAGMAGIATGDPIAMTVGSGFLADGIQLFGQRPLAKMLMNPSVARILAKGFSLTPEQAKSTGWAARVANIYRIFNQPRPLEENRD